MTRGLMGSFADTYTHGDFDYDTEAPESFFDSLERPERNVVVKRISTSHLTLPRLAADIALVYCVRHPFDVLTSAHPGYPERRFYVSEARWRAEYAAYGLLRGLQPSRDILVLRYEDTVTDPDAAQRRIAERLGLVIAAPFSANPAGVSIRTSSLEKWKREPALGNYLDTFDRPFLAEIGRFCEAFGYAVPARYRAWFPEAIRRKPWRRLARDLAAPRVSRLPGNPIIRPEMLPDALGANINGPSLIRTPDWLPGRLGRYYLYFAHHGGDHIRLAYADSLSGPWTIHEGGTLRLSDAPACRGHVASPDVHVDRKRRRIRMYFHGPTARRGGPQLSFVARSKDGLAFKASPEPLAGPYLRMIRIDGGWLGVDQAGSVYRSADGLGAFTRREAALEFAFADVKSTGPVVLRHLALHRVGRALHVYYTRRGDAPERIWRGTIDLLPDWDAWRMGDERPILSPELPWEGADLPVVPSSQGIARGFVNELRDPAIFATRERTFLLYSVAGEAGIAIARLR